MPIDNDVASDICSLQEKEAGALVLLRKVCVKRPWRWRTPGGHRFHTARNAAACLCATQVVLRNFQVLERERVQNKREKEKRGAETKPEVCLPRVLDCLGLHTHVIYIHTEYCGHLIAAVCTPEPDTPADLLFEIQDVFFLSDPVPSRFRPSMIYGLMRADNLAGTWSVDQVSGYIL